MAERKLSTWQKYLSIWVLLCIAAGTALGRLFPQLSDALAAMEVAHVSIPIAICLFFMIYPIMVQISFGEVKSALRSPKPIAATLVMNWAVKPFTMAFFAWLFLNVIFESFLPPTGTETLQGTIPLIRQYNAGLIFLGVAPCTAMVLVWSYLAEGNMGHTFVMTAINTITMVILYAPLATLLLGISGITIPWETLALTVFVYICAPLAAGWLTRWYALREKGEEWFEKSLVPLLSRISISALLITLIVLFAYQGNAIVELPAIIGMLAVPILTNILVIFGIAYLLSRAIRLKYEDAAPTAIIAGSNHFEVAIATATTLFGLNSGASLATVVGVLTEVPIMLFLVWLCKKTVYSDPDL
jgi:ACR3 family arsenite transporter